MIPKTLPWLLALCVSGTCLADQVRAAKDGATIEAAIAKEAPTRIRIQGDRIVDVVGNVQSSSGCDARGTEAMPSPAATPQLPAAPTNPRGDVVLTCNLEKGEVFVTPAAGGDKPISLFVSSPRATYTLRLRRADIEADTIVIDDHVSRKSNAAPDVRSQRSSTHVRSIKALLVAMVAENLPAAYRAEEMDRPMALWQEAEFKLVRQVEGRDLLGEEYVLTNVSGKPMVLAEQEFDREEGDVVAVAIERHNLQPGEATPVYVIRTDGELP